MNPGSQGSKEVNPGALGGPKGGESWGSQGP